MLVLRGPGDPGRVVRSFPELGAAMEWAGQRWYEAGTARPYDIWVRCERSGRLHFAPGLRIRREQGGDWAGAGREPILERPPVP